MGTIDLTDDSFFIQNSASTFDGWEELVVFITLYQTAFDHFSYIIGKGTTKGWLNSNSHAFSWVLNMHRADFSGHRIWGPAINTSTGGNIYKTTNSSAIWTHDGFNGGPSLIVIRYSSNNRSEMSHNFVMKLDGKTFTTANLTGSIKSTSSLSLSIGGTGDGANTWTGRISEVIIFNADLGNQDIEKIEGYLAHKWRLHEKLPLDHPYYPTPPEGSNTLEKLDKVDPGWHHLALSYGETPKSLKLYLDGSLVDDPVTLSGNGLIPAHSNVTSVGAPQGSFALDGFGSFMGTIDDVRIYDRGISANEVTQIFEGDANQTGLVEYRMVEKPKITTLPAMEVRPQSVTLRANLESIGGEIIEEEISIGKNFDQNTVPGIQAWYDAEKISGQNGQSLNRWQDYSGRPNQDRSFTNVNGSPRLLSFALNGKAAVSFDGEDDQLWTGYNFESLLQQTGYSIITLARFTEGNANRIITSRNKDFYFGFNQREIGVWRAGGDITLTGDPIDNAWHLHVGTISDNSGDPLASLWQDGILKVFESRGSDNHAFGPGQLQIGGVNNQNSACEVAEILIYSGEINSMERSLIEGYLAHKWNLNEEVLPDTHPYYSFNPFGISINQTSLRSVGGDPSEITIYWGNEYLETESTVINENNDSLWDHKIVLSQSANIGQYEISLTDNLEEGESYYFRAHAKNIAGETWSKRNPVFPNH